MSLIAIIILILLGFVFLAIEFLLIPGITIAGVAALILLGGGVFSAYFFHGNLAGHYTLASTLAGMVLFLMVILKTKTWQRFGLTSEIDSRIGTLDGLPIAVGQTGETVSRLAPIGKALIEGQLYEVHSDGSFIDSHSAVKVNRIEGNKIYVELQ